MTLPRTSPEMYALYWNPMNWKSITPAMRKKGQVRPSTGPKLKLVPVRPASLAAFASWPTVVPLAYFGRLAAKVPASKVRSPATAITIQPPMPKIVSHVTILWNVRVGCSTTKATTASTARPAIMPGMPVTSPVLPSVNQLSAPVKKLLPVPMPMILPSIWIPRSVREVSNCRRAIEAKASIQLSSQPRNGPTLGMMRLVKT